VYTQCVCVGMYMCVCIYIYIYIYIYYIYIYIYIFIYIYIYIYICIYIYIHIYVCVYRYKYTYIYRYKYTCIYVYIYTWYCIYTCRECWQRASAQTLWGNTHLHVYTYLFVYSYTYTRVHMYIFVERAGVVCKHTCIQTCICKMYALSIHAYKDAYVKCMRWLQRASWDIHTYEYIHMVYTCILWYTYIHIRHMKHILICKFLHIYTHNIHTCKHALITEGIAI